MTGPIFVCFEISLAGGLELSFLRLFPWGDVATRLGDM